REVINAFVTLDDFVGDAGESAGDAIRVHDDRGLAVGHVHLFAVSQGRVKELIQYTPLSMLVDVEARVISNTRLSSDYNVIALATEDGSIGDRARITAPLERELQNLRIPDPGSRIPDVMIYAC